MKRFTFVSAWFALSVAPYACSGESSDAPISGNDRDAGLPLVDGSPRVDGSASSVDATVDVVTTIDASPGDATTTSDAATDAADAAADVEIDGAMDAAIDADADVDAGPPGTIPASEKAVTQQDLVSPGDKGLTGDGSNDGTITATVVGPVDGLILVTTDANGNPAGGQQWDTLSGSDPVPSIGSPFTLGSQTWVVGVFENGVLQNDANARISLGAGVHALTLAASSSGYFVAGQHFRLYVHAAGGNWMGGPTFQW